MTLHKHACGKENSPPPDNKVRVVEDKPAHAQISVLVQLSQQNRFSSAEDDADDDSDTDNDEFDDGVDEDAQKDQ